MTDRFSISPAQSSGPAAVRLSMPASGYEAAPSITDPCGHAIPGATVTVLGDVATPHLPATYTGTAYLDWTVQAVSQPTAGARIHLILASRQDIGRASSCITGPSPYGRHAGVAIPPARPHAAPTQAYGIAGASVLTALLLAAVGVWLNRRRPRRKAGTHAR